MSTLQAGSSVPNNGQNLPVTVSIMGKNIPLIVYRDQPVVTLRTVDELHGKVHGARDSFNRHKDYFVEGEDYFKLPYKEWSSILVGANSVDYGNHRNSLTFLTESGYLLAVKPFKDELSWKIQKALVRSYFALRRMHTDAEQGKVSPELQALLSKLGVVDERPGLKEIPEQMIELAREADKNPYVAAILEKSGIVPKIPEQIIELAKQADGNPYIAAILEKAGISPNIETSSTKPTVATHMDIRTAPSSQATIQHSSVRKSRRGRVSNSKILYAKDVAALLGVTPQKISHWNQNGRFDGYKSGDNPLRFSLGRLRSWAKHERLEELTSLPTEISSAEACKFLGVSITSIQKAVRDKVIEGSKDKDGHYSIKSESLINLM